MPSLRSLLSSVAPASNTPQNFFYVYNTDQHRTTSNGGASCVWTVPAGVTSVTFELWGGGSSGPGARCCSGPIQAGSAGGYAIRTIPTAEGCSYTICAGGSTTYGTSTVGNPGNPTFVSGSGIATTCAAGGVGGFACCFTSGMITCCAHTISSIISQGDFKMQPMTGAVYGDTQVYHMAQLPSSAPKYGSFSRSASMNLCFQNQGLQNGYSTFPGGGGMGAYSCCCVTCRCGAHGSGGLVRVTYS